MAVPVLTIPESAFDPSAYTPGSRKQSQLLRYLLSLTRGSAGLLILAYVVGLFAFKPLMELTVTQRLDFLEACRGKLRDLYLNLIGRVSYIPIVAINRNDGSGKLYADSVCQTQDLHKQQQEQTLEVLGLGAVHLKLSKLSLALKQCHSYLVSEMPHYKVVDFLLKDFRQKTDMVYFNHRELFLAKDESKGAKGSKSPNGRNLAQEIKTSIRSTKGMYMSGQV